MVVVIRIAPKWLIGLLCGYVITTAGMTEAHHIRHQLEAYVVMMSRLLLVKLLCSHDDNKWIFICLKQNVPMSIVSPHTRAKTAVSPYFPLVYFTERPQAFQHMHLEVWQILYCSRYSLQILVELPYFKL